MKWSVGLTAVTEHVLSREEIVELADAVAVHDGVASGIGTNRYGARLVVDAANEDEAVEKATAAFVQAVLTAGLPPAPVELIDAMSEEDDEADWNP